MALDRYPHPSIYQEEEKSNHHNRTNETGLLYNDREDKIVMSFWKIIQFLDAPTQASSKKTTGIKSKKGLNNLITLTTDILKGIKERLYSVCPVFSQTTKLL